MASEDEWESVDNLDELIRHSLGTLETEDVIYLEEYLNGEGDLGCHSPSLWSALRERSEGSVSTTVNTTHHQQVHAHKTHQYTSDEETPEAVDDSQVSVETASGSDTAGPRPTLGKFRVTRGVVKPKFVSYEAFPPTKDKPFTCEVCGLRLATRESRRRHIIAKHIKERNNVCSVCGKNFVFKFSLKAHAAIHSATPNFTCVCGQTFSVRGSYMNHVRRVHQAVSEVKFSCELCFKSFVDHHTLRLHLISVHKPKTIPCLHTGCKKVFSTTALMKSHYWYHLKHRFPCDECGQTFSTESYMYKHRRTHSGVRPYLCVDCGKTYLSVSHLNKHRRTAHSSYRPFQCSFCGKCYKTKDQLTFHESSHRGEKPYQCEVCGYATAYRNTYYAHRKKHKTHQTSSPTDIAQNKDVRDSSTRDRTPPGGNTTNNTARKNNKTKTPKGKTSLLKLKSSPEDMNSKTLHLNKTVSPHMSKLNTGLRDIKTPSYSINEPPSTTPHNVICIVSSEPSDNSILSGCNSNLSESFPMHISNQSKEIQLSASYLPSEPLSLVHPPDTEIVYHDSQQNDKSEPHTIVANSDTSKEDTKKNSEEQTSCIILSNGAKCSFPTCESGDSESLLLVKVDDESYIALCTHHALTNLTILKEGMSVKGASSVSLSADDLASLSYQNETTDQVTIDTVDQKEANINSNISESLSCSQSSPEHHKKHTSNCESLLMSHSASTTPEICVSDGPVSQQVEDAKPSPAVGLTEHLSTMMELDPGMSTLAAPTVDESFSLAQIEVHCPMCEEQFLCMDDYVTHLESCHD